uniref:Uncharacterized protein n=1 Tax=Timema tahoe TaxID=61484 RepID=A0A7R9NUX1_9NEOP|nr:unnamed protein product [Timema tahoe]
MLRAVESTRCVCISGPGMFTLELAADGISRIGYSHSRLDCADDEEIKLENAGVEVCDDLYSAYCSLLSRRPEEDGTHYKHYLLSNYEEDIITLKESCSLVSQGTTGLCSWQAAEALAEWCVTHRLMLAHKEILELGSGVGLTGLTVSLCCRPRSFHFSDCHPAVLQFLCHNVALNAKHPAKIKPSEAEDGQTRTSQEDCKVAESPCNRIEQMEVAQNMSKHCETNKCNRSDNELLCAANIRNLENYISERSPDKEPSSSICCPRLSNNETCVTYRYHSDRTKRDASQDNYKLKSPTWLKCYASSGEGPTGNQNLDDVVDERVKYRTNFNGTLLQVLYLPWEDIPHNIVGVKLSPDFVLAADVVYDVSIFDPLCNAFCHFIFQGKHGCTVVLACTVRNNDTLEQFLSLLDSRGLQVKEEEFETTKMFLCEADTPINIYSITAPL